MNGELLAEAAKEQPTETILTQTEEKQPELQMFDLNEPFQKSGKAHFRGSKVNITHIVDRPSFEQHRQLDDKNPYRSMPISEMEDEVVSDLTGKHNIPLYDKLVRKTEGYKLNVQEGQSKEEREAALKGIPSRHKKDIMTYMLTVKSEVVYENEKAEDTFVWGDNQEYRVRTEIGPNADFVIYSTIREFSQEQLDAHEGAAKLSVEKGFKKPVTKITSTSIPVAVSMFDANKVSVEGVVVGKEAFDLNNPLHLAKLDAHIKRSIVDAVVKETRLDLGE